MLAALLTPAAAYAPLGVARQSTPDYGKIAAAAALEGHNVDMDW
jgi:hypothetical protein